MQAVVLLDSNPTPIRAGETSYLHTFDGSKDVLAPMLRIQERNFAFVTLVIKIVVHG